MQAIKVLLIDNDEGQLQNIEPAVGRILGAAGYHCETTPILVDKVEKTSAKKIERAMAERPDIVFVDNHFGKDPGLASWGFLWISSVKKKHPDSIFVLITREDLISNEFGKSVPHPDIIVSKQRFIKGDDEYDDFFRATFIRFYRRTKVGRIDVDDKLKRALGGLRARRTHGSSLTDVQLRSLIEQICYMGREAADGNLEVVSLEKLDGGLSGAVTCTITLTEKAKAYKVRGVIKIAGRNSATAEVVNHSRYVKWMLPYTWRVDIIGAGETDEFGAVCYAFAHGGHDDPPVSLATAIMDSTKTQIVDVLAAVFDPQRQTWYEQERVVPGDLGSYLSGAEPYFTGPEDLDRKADQLRRLMIAVAEKHGIPTFRNASTCLIHLKHKVIDLHNIEQKLFSENWHIPARECICHGDLNAGNIMVRPSTSDFSFIDFRHTGWHQRARDFCSIESSLRTLYPRRRARTFTEYVEQERRRLETEGNILHAGLNKDERKNKLNTYLKKCLQRLKTTSNEEREIVGVVRALFLMNFENSTMKEYALAQLAHTWWLICFENTWSEKQLETLVANYLVLLSYLWGDR